MNLLSKGCAWPVWATLGIAALIIGCGGGGGGGSTTATTVTTASSATSANGTSATTTTPTTASAVGSAGTTPTAPGSLPQNTIFYGLANTAGQYNVMQVNPDGTKNVPFISNLTENGPGSVHALALNPNVAGQYAVAISNSSNVEGIYLANISATGVISNQQTLVAPAYSDVNGLGVSSMVVTQDGTKAVYVAADPNGQETDVFVVSLAGGVQTPSHLAQNVNFATVGQDSNTVVYSSPVGNDDQLFRGTLSTNLANPTQITSDTATHDYPSIGRTGRYVVFSTLPDNSTTLEYQLAVLDLTVAGATPVPLLGNSSLSEIAPSLNSDDSEVAFIGQGSLTNGVYTLPASGAIPAQAVSKLDENIFGSTAWTSSNGRTAGGGSGFGLSNRQKKK